MWTIAKDVTRNVVLKSKTYVNFYANLKKGHKQFGWSVLKSNEFRGSLSRASHFPELHFQVCFLYLVFQIVS